MHRRRALWPLLALIALPPGCAVCPTTPPATLAKLQALPSLEELTTQSKPDDCDLRWGRAQVWLARHSFWKLQPETDLVLGSAPLSGNGYTFRIIREPRPDGSCRIGLQMGCLESGSCVCSPSPDLVLRAFYHYLDSGEDVIHGGYPYLDASIRLGDFGVRSVKEAKEKTSEADLKTKEMGAP